MRKFKLQYCIAANQFSDYCNQLNDWKQQMISYYRSLHFAQLSVLCVFALSKTMKEF